MSITSTYLSRLRSDFFYNSKRYIIINKEIVKNKEEIIKIILEDGFKNLSEEERNYVEIIPEFRKDIVIVIPSTKSPRGCRQYLTVNVPIFYYNNYGEFPKELKVKVDKHVKILEDLYYKLSYIEEIWDDLINRDTKMKELKKFFPEIYNRLLEYQHENKTI